MSPQSQPKTRPEIFARQSYNPDAPMTEDQGQLLSALSEEAGVPFDHTLTQLAAHERIIAIRDYLSSPTIRQGEAS